jgi:hypothetical protein
MRKGTGGAANGKPAPRQLADARQAAILLLRRIAVRDNERNKPTTRAQFTVPMLRRLWNRPRLSPEFLEDVSTWLAVAGWCFFNAGATYAAVRISAVKNWPRLGTAKIAKELDQVAKGQYPFEDHEHLLVEDTDRTAVSENGGEEDADDKTSNDE